MMNIPSKVRIGSFDYLVNLTEDTLIYGNHVCDGLIDYDKMTIDINTSIQGPQRQEQTFLHELVHGIVQHYNINLPEESVEDIVDKIGYGLHQVIRDNPEIFCSETTGRVPGMLQPDHNGIGVDKHGE